MKKEVSIRKATIKDFKLAYAIDIMFINHLIKKYSVVRQTYDPKFMKKPLRDLVKKTLKSRKKGYFILEENNKPVGYSEFEIKKSDRWMKAKKNGHIGCLFLFPKYRKKGYGSLLMNHTMNFLKEKGCDIFSLGVNMGNPSHRLYAKLGFKDVFITMYKSLK